MTSEKIHFMEEKKQITILLHISNLQELLM